MFVIITPAKIERLKFRLTGNQVYFVFCEVGLGTLMSTVNPLMLDTHSLPLHPILPCLGFIHLMLKKIVSPTAAILKANQNSVAHFIGEIGGAPSLRTLLNF